MMSVSGAGCLVCNSGIAGIVHNALLIMNAAALCRAFLARRRGAIHFQRSRETLSPRR